MFEPPTGEARGATHWSRARLARQFGVSASTVGRVWREARLQPHRVETFKYSSDPQLVAKVTDVVGLYLAPPERAIVLSVDEKTQIQAIDHTQPMLPLWPGQVERHTHDYRRNGTTSLFAALEVATGTVHSHHAGAPHRGRLPGLPAPGGARAYPEGELHLVLDNVSTHKTPAVQRWPPPARPLPLHVDLGVVDELGRDLVRHPDPPCNPPRQLRERARPVGRHRALHPRVERIGHPVHLGQDR